MVQTVEYVVIVSSCARGFNKKLCHVLLSIVKLINMFASSIMLMYQFIGYSIILHKTLTTTIIIS